jgi:hypothetical protein
MGVRFPPPASIERPLGKRARSPARSLLWRRCPRRGNPVATSVPGLAERHALHPRPGRADAQGAASGVTPAATRPRPGAARRTATRPPRRTGRRDGMRCEGQAANRWAGTRQTNRAYVKRSRHRELRHRRRGPLRRVRQSVSPDIRRNPNWRQSPPKRPTRSRTTGAASPPFTPAARRGTYVERMHHHSDVWNRVHECPNCARHVRLTREDRYRRHFATEPDGRLRLCPASGHAFAGVVAPGLHRLDL